MSGFMEANVNFLKALANLRFEPLTKLMEVVTLLGDETVTILLLALLCWCVSKRLAYGVGVAYFISGNVAQGMKIAFRIPRPWNLDPSFIAVESTFIENMYSYSFPSGHTQAGAALFGTMGFALRERWKKVTCFVLVGVVAFTRLYLGSHTPLDVFTSLILFMPLAWFVAKVLCGDIKKSLDIRAGIVVLAVSAALIILSLVLAGSGAILVEFAEDSCKSAGAAIGFVLGSYWERHYIGFETKTRRWWMQIVKYICGLVGVFGILELKPLFNLLGNQVAADTLRYLVMSLWMWALFPLIVKKVSSRNDSPKVTVVKS